MKLSDILQSLQSNPETLEEKANRLEKQVVKLEADARLRKRIADAEKRIKAVKPSGGVLGNIGGSGVRGGLVKAIVVVTILVVIVIIISKAC